MAEFTVEVTSYFQKKVTVIATDMGDAMTRADIVLKEVQAAEEISDLGEHYFEDIHISKVR